MNIRDLKTEPLLNEMVRRGYRHQGNLGIIMNSQSEEGFPFRIGHPYRVEEGRIMLFQRGSMKVEVDMIECTYSSGGVAVVMPGSVVVFEAIGSDCIAHAALFRDLPVKGESFCVSGDDAFFADTLRYFELIFDKLGQPLVPSEVLSHLYIAMITDILSHRTLPQLSPSATLLRRFVELVNAEGLTKHPAAWYAERLFVSQSHLGAVVRAASGMTPMQWIDRALIREAKVLLFHTDLPVAEVAERLGFATPSFFIHFFHKNTGTTPLQFRKQR